MCFGQLGRDAWSTPIRIILATVEVGPFASHEGLDMFETEMREALVPKQELLLRAGQVGIGRIEDAWVWKHTWESVNR
jgi:hypothetical protein